MSSFQWPPTGGSGAGTGTVTSISVATANGLAGTVATATTTPVITLSTTITGVLKGNGTAISAQTTGNLTEATSSVLTITGGTGAVLGSGATIQVKQSSTSVSGYLSSTDWTTFNNKQDTITEGNLTEVTSSVLTITGGTNSVIGSGTTILVKQASTSVSGYLSNTDWNTFNGKQASGSYITALTGDGTAAGPGSAALTLATVNSNVGSFGSSTSIPSFTVNAKGLVTAASGNVVIAPAGTLTGTTLASNVVTSSLTTVGTIGTGTWSGTTIALNKGGTGQTTKAAAFDALQPMSASGDIIYGGVSGTGTRLAKGSDGDVLTLASGLPSWAAAGGGGATQEFHISAACTTKGSGTAATTFTTFGNSPSLSFTATNSGTFRVWCSVPATMFNGADYGVFRIAATTGSPTVLAESQAQWNDPVGAGAIANVYVATIFTLVATTAYVFDLQGKTAIGGSTIYADGAVAQFFIVCEKIGS